MKITFKVNLIIQSIILLSIILGFFISYELICFSIFLSFLYYFLIEIDIIEPKSYENKPK